MGSVKRSGPLHKIICFQLLEYGHEVINIEVVSIVNVEIQSLIGSRGPRYLENYQKISIRLQSVYVYIYIYIQREIYRYIPNLLLFCKGSSKEVVSERENILFYVSCWLSVSWICQVIVHHGQISFLFKTRESESQPWGLDCQRGQDFE